MGEEARYSSPHEHKVFFTMFQNNYTVRSLSMNIDFLILQCTLSVFICNVCTKAFISYFSV